MPSFIPRDKILHLLAGAVLYVLGDWLAGAVFGMGLCAGGGAAKEAWDALTGRGTAEFADFLATCAGGALAGLLLAASQGLGSL